MHRRSLIIVLAASVAHAQAPRVADTLLVSTAWLAQHLSDPKLVLLHVGPKDEYDARHIPGARFVSLQDLSRRADDLSLEMPTPDTLRDRLAALGVSNDSRIVVYYAKMPLTQATRVVFTLDYAGLGSRTSLLDGGMETWVAEQRPLTADVPPARAGTLAALRTRPLIVDAQYMLAHLKKPGVAIVDARAPAFYSGAQRGGSPNMPHALGHIPGAGNVPFSEITDPSARLKSGADLAALFAKAGVQPGDTVVTYCHIGQQATATLFAARTLGHPVLLYDGSFEDWSRRANTPVERP